MSKKRINLLSTPLLESKDQSEEEKTDTKSLSCDETITLPLVNDDVDSAWSPSNIWWRDFLHFVGPGWLVCIAYVDPGNYQSDIFTGATSRYNLLFALWWITLVSIYLQALSVRLAYYGQVSLAEVQAKNNSPILRYFNWAVAELSCILADFPQVVGCGVALNVFFGWPYYVGILLSVVTTMIFLLSLKLGLDKLEIIASVFIGIMSICLFVEMGFVNPDFGEIMRGWTIGFVDLKGNQASAITGLIGSIAMPHNFYMHSASVLSSHVRRDEMSVKAAIKYSSLEPIFPIIITFFVNLACISIAAERVSGTKDAKHVGLTDFCNYFSTLKGGCVLWGLSLLAAGQSSAITVTFAGQYVMDGFLDMKLSVRSRAILSRVITIVPCAIASAVFPNRLNQIVNVVNSIISFLLPFALTPLVKYNCSEEYMGKYACKGFEKGFLYFLTIVIWALNAWGFSVSGGGLFGFVVGMDVSFSKIALILVEIAVQIFYLWWNINCITSPVFSPMRPLHEVRPHEERIPQTHFIM